MPTMATEPLLTHATYPDLDGRVVVVTGGASGIGLAIARALIEQGAKVAVLDLDEPTGLDLEGAGGLALRCDLRDQGALDAARDRIMSELGHVGVIVNNAGNDARHDVETLTPTRWDDLMAVNLRHHFFVTQAFLPGMRALGRGSVIGLGSISARMGSRGLPAYVTAKAGIEGLTRALARELGPVGIRVNCILPGMVVTERQLRLWLTPDGMAAALGSQCLKFHVAAEDVAAMALFLASDASRAVTSQSLVVDCGWI